MFITVELLPSSWNHGPWGHPYLSLARSRRVDLKRAVGLGTAAERGYFCRVQCKPANVWAGRFNNASGNDTCGSCFSCHTNVLNTLQSPQFMLCELVHLGINGTQESVFYRYQDTDVNAHVVWVTIS